MMKYCLFIDDIRHPATVLNEDKVTFYHSVRTPILWARDIEQAKWYVQNYGMPDVFHLDHDLGYIVGQSDEIITTTDATTTSTVMDFLNWLKKEYDLGKQMPPEHYIHSANPVGKQNIQAFFQSWMSVWSSNQLKK